MGKLSFIITIIIIKNISMVKRKSKSRIKIKKSKIRKILYKIDQKVNKSVYRKGFTAFII